MTATKSRLEASRLLKGNFLVKEISLGLFRRQGVCIRRAGFIAGICRGCAGTGFAHVGCARAFCIFNDIKAHLIATLQCFEAIHLNNRVMYENIFAAIIGANKAKAFVVLKKFYGSGELFHLG